LFFNYYLYEHPILRLLRAGQSRFRRGGARPAAEEVSAADAGGPDERAETEDLE
jgi:hypothetical protein